MAKMNDLFKHVRDHLVWDHDLEDVDSEINDIAGAANDAEVLHTLNLYAPQIPGHEVGTPEHSVMWLHQYEHSDDPFTGSGEIQNHTHEDDPRYPRGHGSWKTAEIIPFPPGSEGEDDGNPFGPFSMSEWQMVKGPKKRKSNQAQDATASQADETQSERENTKPVQDLLNEQSPQSVSPWSVYMHLVVEHDYPVLDDDPHLFGDPRHEGTPGMDHLSPSFHHSIHSAVHLMGNYSKHHHRQREPEGDRDEFGFPKR